MNTERIEEIMKELGIDYFESIPIQQALLKVWNETAQDYQEKICKLKEDIYIKDDHIKYMDKTLDSLDKFDDRGVWLSAWLAVAGSTNSTKQSITILWADDCLKAFKKRFP